MCIDCIITVAHMADKKLLKIKIYPRVNNTILTRYKECFFFSSIVILALRQDISLGAFPRRTVEAATHVTSAISNYVVAN